MPAAKRGDNLIFASLASARRNFSGFFSSRPQPSPVLPSVAIAPRWVRRLREAMAVCTSQWLGLSSSMAIRPKPQPPRSNASRCTPRLLSLVIVVALSVAHRPSRASPSEAARWQAPWGLVLQELCDSGGRSGTFKVAGAGGQGAPGHQMPSKYTDQRPAVNAGLDCGWALELLQGQAGGTQRDHP